MTTKLEGGGEVKTLVVRTTKGGVFLRLPLVLNGVFKVEACLFVGYQKSFTFSRTTCAAA